MELMCDEWDILGGGWSAEAKGGGRSISSHRGYNRPVHRDEQHAKHQANHEKYEGRPSDEGNFLSLLWVLGINWHWCWCFT
jgi:hypothetical protein